MIKPLVSVLMTVYNREAYIAEAIESVCNSSWQNWELIIVDDCSSDRSVEIARDYESKDPRIKVYVNEKNLTDYPNRNQAATFAIGKYIKYLDSDDLIYFYGLELQVRSLEANPDAGASLMAMNMPEDKPFPRYYTSEEAYRAFFYKGAMLTVGPSACMFRRDVFEELGKFSGMNYSGDTEFLLKLSARYPIVTVPPSFFFYRIHDNQQLSEGNRNNTYTLYNHKVYISALNDNTCPLPQNEIKKLKQAIKLRFLGVLVKQLLKGRVKGTLEFWRVLRVCK